MSKTNNNQHNSNVVSNKAARDSFAPVLARLVEAFNDSNFSLHKGFDHQAAAQMTKYKICRNSRNVEEFLKDPCSTYCTTMLNAIDWSNSVLSEGILAPPKADLYPDLSKTETNITPCAVLLTNLKIYF